MPGIISAVDSYYSWVKHQMLEVLNAQVFINGATVAQPFGGVAEATDWPTTQPIEGALYLLVLDQHPTLQDSMAQMEYQYFLQWVWYLLGTDLGSTQQGQNRADRYRSHMTVLENLRQANMPHFCQKMDYAANAQGVVVATPSQSQYPVSSIEMVRWSPLKFMPFNKGNTQDGVLYYAAAVEVYAMDDVNPLVA